MAESTTSKADENVDQKSLLKLGIISKGDQAKYTSPQEGRNGDVAENSDASQMTQKVPNDVSAAQENSDRWNDLIKIKPGGNGQFYLDIDPNLLSEEVVQKFWRENATKVGSPMDMNIFERLIEWVKAIINKIVKAVTGKENLLAMRPGQSMRIQNPSMEGAMNLRTLLINEIKEQSDSLKTTMEALGLNEKNPSKHAIDSFSKNLDDKLSLIRKEDVSIDFTDMGRTEVVSYIESLDEHVKRSVAADKKVAQELMRNPNALSMLMKAHPSVFESQSKAALKALESVVAGSPSEMKKATAIEAEKLVLKAYNLQEHAESIGKSDTALSSFFADEKGNPLGDAIGMREALRVRDAKFSPENINALEIKMDQESEMFKGRFLEKVSNARNALAVPHFLASPDEKRWFDRRKQDIADGVRLSQAFEKKNDWDDRRQAINLPTESYEERIPKADLSHRQLLDKFIAMDNAVSEVLALSSDEKIQVFEAIRKEALYTNNIDIKVNPFENEFSNSTERKHDEIEGLKTLFRNAFAGPAPDSDGTDGLKRSEYELFVYRTGLALFEELKDANDVDRRDYASEYELERSSTNENDRSYVARQALSL